MKYILKTLAITALCLSAQHATAALTQTTTKVVEILPREWGLHIKIEAAAAAQLTAAGVTCPANIYPVYELAKADYKLVKDSILLAYALKKSIRIYVDVGPNVCLVDFPKIYAIDVLAACRT